MASKKNNSHPLQFKNIYFETSEMLSYPSKNQKSTPKLSRKIISIHIHFPCPIAKLTYNIYTLFNASINICTLMYVAIDNMFMYISSVRVRGDGGGSSVRVSGGGGGGRCGGTIAAWRFTQIHFLKFFTGFSSEIKKSISRKQKWRKRGYEKKYEGNISVLNWEGNSVTVIGPKMLLGPNTDWQIQ